MKPALTKSEVRNRTTYLAPKQYPANATFCDARQYHTLCIWGPYLAIVLLPKGIDTGFHNRIYWWRYMRDFLCSIDALHPCWNAESSHVAIERHWVTVKKVRHKHGISVADHSAKRGQRGTSINLYPFSAYWSARSWALTNLWPMISVRLLFGQPKMMILWAMDGLAYYKIPWPFDADANFGSLTYISVSPTVLIRPCGWPSCLTPLKQHVPRALDAMFDVLIDKGFQLELFCEWV